MLQVSVLIVNYNTAAEVIQCVHSVLAQQGVTFDIWVIDNASHDMSVKRLQETFSNIHVIENARNVGFGAANNIGAAGASGEYLYFLNPDAQLIGSDSLLRLYTFLKDRPACGLAGTRVIETASGRKIKAAYHYPGQAHLKNTAGIANLPGKIAWIQGSSMLIKKSLFDQLHGFDDNYFLYAEETDLCLRVRKAGYCIEVCPDASVEHIGGASQRHEKVAATRLRKQQALYLFYQKHYSHADCQRLAKRARKHATWKILWLRWRLYWHVSAALEIALIRQHMIRDAAQAFLTKTAILIA